MFVPVTTVWRLLELQMQEKAYIYEIHSFGQPINGVWVRG